MPTTEPHADLEDWADYEGTPFLTLLVNFFSATGVMIVIYALLFLPGAIHEGTALTLYILIAAELLLNVALRLIRARRRRALGLSRSERRYRLGIGEREPQRGP